MSEAEHDASAAEIIRKLQEVLVLLDSRGFHRAAIDVNQAIENMRAQIFHVQKD